MGQIIYLNKPSRPPRREVGRCQFDVLRDGKGIYGVGWVGDPPRDDPFIASMGFSIRGGADSSGNRNPVLQRIPYRHPAFFWSTEYEMQDTLRRILQWEAGFGDMTENWGSDVKSKQDANRRKFHGYRRLAHVVINRLVGQALEFADPETLKLARRFPLMCRFQMYQAFVTEGKYARQLAETFPALALEIYAIRRFDGKLSDRAKVAKQMVTKGTSLLDVASTMGMPMAFRKVKPGACRDLLETSNVLAPWPNLIHTYLPDTQPGMRRWLTAIRIFQTCGEPFIEWTAKHALLLGATSNDIAQQLFDIWDWVKACYSGSVPDYVKKIITRSVDQDSLGESFVTRPFNPDMSLATVLTLSEQWHEAVADGMTDSGNNVEFPTPWFSEGRVNGYQVSPITDYAGLYREGHTMRHCVAINKDSVLNGRCYFYSVTKNDEHVATVGLGHDLEKGRVFIIQMTGKCNSKVAPGVRKSVRKWLQDSRSRHGVENVGKQIITEIPKDIFQ